jgi:hypothetical protein
MLVVFVDMPPRTSRHFVDFHIFVCVVPGQGCNVLHECVRSLRPEYFLVQRRAYKLWQDHGNVHFAVVVTKWVTRCVSYCRRRIRVTYVMRFQRTKVLGEVICLCRVIEIVLFQAGDTHVD